VTAFRALPFLLATLSSPALADTLIVLGSNSQGAEIFVDRDSLRQVRADGARRFPATQINAIIRTPGGRRSGPVSEMMTLSFNCTARTMNTLSYIKEASTGKRSHDWKAADIAVKYAPIRPGSLAELAMIFACSGGKLPAPVLTPMPGHPGMDEEE